MLHINLDSDFCSKQTICLPGHLFIVAIISIKFCMHADTNVTIPGAKFPNIGIKIDIN